MEVLSLGYTTGILCGNLTQANISHPLTALLDTTTCTYFPATESVSGIPDLMQEEPWNC